jgi:hypothetical protein
LCRSYAVIRAETYGWEGDVPIERVRESAVPTELVVERVQQIRVSAGHETDLEVYLSAFGRIRGGRGFGVDAILLTVRRPCAEYRGDKGFWEEATHYIML